MNINKLGNELVRSKTNLNSIASALYFDWVFLFFSSSSSSSLFSIFESFSLSPFLYNSRNFTPNDRIWIKNNENNYRMRGRGEKRKQKSSFFAFFLMLFQIIIITKTKKNNNNNNNNKNNNNTNNSAIHCHDRRHYRIVV